VGDDLEPDDVPEDDQNETDEDLYKLARELFGPDPVIFATRRT
jgi:hypothetical protein